MKRCRRFCLKGLEDVMDTYKNEAQGAFKKNPPCAEITTSVKILQWLSFNLAKDYSARSVKRLKLTTVSSLSVAFR